MGPIGIPEMLIILVVALIFFGPRKLPELGRSLGRSINEFKRASNDLRNTLDDEIRAEERKTVVTNPTDPTNIASPAAPETVARGQGSQS
jgi:sec-independent protein translocase protein TatA